MKKFERIAETLVKQIEKGDFSLSGLPSERILAEKLAVNRLTVRKALAVLEQNDLIHKLSTGRHEITQETTGSENRIRIALLASPAFSSGNLRIWYEELVSCAAKHNFLFRPFLFVHWNDASISDILAKFDGVFIDPSEEEIPKETLELFRSQNGLVMLNTDMSHQGVFSINLFPKIFVRQILDRLADMGHKSIACLHLQTDKSNTLNDRIDQWEYWSALNENKEPLIQADINPFNEGEDFVTSLIKKGRFKNSTAVFCTTIHAAIALIRACKNNGIDPEKDIAICTIDDEGIGMHSTPSVSCFKKPDIQNILRPVFKWIENGGEIRNWKGPLLVEPSSLEIYEGETFHIPPKSAKRQSK